MKPGTVHIADPFMRSTECLKPHPRETFGCGPPRDLPHSR